MSINEQTSMSGQCRKQTSINEQTSMFSYRFTSIRRVKSPRALCPLGHSHAGNHVIVAPQPGHQMAPKIKLQSQDSENVHGPQSCRQPRHCCPSAGSANGNQGALLAPDDVAPEGALVAPAGALVLQVDTQEGAYTGRFDSVEVSMWPAICGGYWPATRWPTFWGCIGAAAGSSPAPGGGITTSRLSCRPGSARRGGVGAGAGCQSSGFCWCKCLHMNGVEIAMSPVTSPMKLRRLACTAGSRFNSLPETPVWFKPKSPTSS